MTEWLPIESAPKDGRKLLGWRFYGPEIMKWKHYHRTDEWVFSGSDESDDVCEYLEHPFTHWMPLPPGPTITVTGSYSEGSDDGYEFGNYSAVLLEGGYLEIAPAGLTDAGLLAAYRRTSGEGEEAEALLAEIVDRGLEI